MNLINRGAIASALTCSSANAVEANTNATKTSTAIHMRFISVSPQLMVIRKSITPCHALPKVASNPKSDGQSSGSRRVPGILSPIIASARSCNCNCNCKCNVLLLQAIQSMTYFCRFPAQGERSTYYISATGEAGEARTPGNETKSTAANSSYPSALERHRFSIRRF